MAEDEIVRLAAAGTLQEANLWKSVLEQEGIACRVVGDYLTAGIGIGHIGEPEVWVHRGDLERARAVLDSHQKTVNGS